MHKTSYFGFVLMFFGSRRVLPSSYTVAMLRPPPSHFPWTLHHIALTVTTSAYPAVALDEAFEEGKKKIGTVQRTLTPFFF